MAGTDDIESTKATYGSGSDRQSSGQTNGVNGGHHATNGVNGAMKPADGPKPAESEALRRWKEQNERAEAWNHYSNGSKHGA